MHWQWLNIRQASRNLCVAALAALALSLGACVHTQTSADLDDEECDPSLASCVVHMNQRLRSYRPPPITTTSQTTLSTSDASMAPAIANVLQRQGSASMMSDPQRFPRTSSRASFESTRLNRVPHSTNRTLTSFDSSFDTTNPFGTGFGASGTSHFTRTSNTVQ